jgi:hypothetical protein
MLESFRGLRKFFALNTPGKFFSREVAKRPSFGLFVFTFMSLREICPFFGCGFAALGRSCASW